MSPSGSAGFASAGRQVRPSDLVTGLVPVLVVAVDVQFTPLSGGQTRVVLEHRHIDRHGPGWEAVHEGTDGDQGWPLHLDRYAAITNRAS